MGTRDAKSLWEICSILSIPPSFQNQQAPQLPNPNPQLSLPFPQQQPSQQNTNPQLMLPYQQKTNQLPAQPLPNPNNKNPQNTYMVEGKQFPTYMIVPVNDVQLRSGRVFEKPSIDIQEQDTAEEDSLQVNKGSEEESLQNSKNSKRKRKANIHNSYS